MDWIDDNKWDAIQDFVGDAVAEFDFTLTGTDGSVEAVRLTSLDAYNVAVVEITETSARITCEGSAYVEADIFAYNPFDYEVGPSYKEAGEVDGSCHVAFDIVVVIRRDQLEPYEIDSIEITSSGSTRLHVPDSWRRERPHWR